MKMKYDELNEVEIKDFFDDRKLESKNLDPAEFSYIIDLIKAKWYTYDKMIKTKRLSSELPREDMSERYEFADICTEMAKLNTVMINGPKELLKPAKIAYYEYQKQLEKLNLPIEELRMKKTEWLNAMTCFATVTTRHIREKYKDVKVSVKDFDRSKHEDKPDLLEAQALYKSIAVVDGANQKLVEKLEMQQGQGKEHKR